MIADPSWLDDRVTITRINADGSTAQVDHGPTLRERQAAHVAGTCDALCSFCYADACAFAEKN